ncbi:peroxidase family protein [Mesorhizobium sp. M0589]|uniref:peroxidase family protein n=1 Tax=Mesorhizobium sp. M0589 TaxID=2956965 RepID=UPI00333BB7ED
MDIQVTVPGNTALTTIFVSASPTHFRNFGMTIGDAPDIKDVYVGLGKAWDTQVMFAKLMRRMNEVYTFKDGVTSHSDANVNKNIPAGYTYLGQFAAHDIIRNSALLTDLAAAETNRKNMRENSLLLDALYGDGPAFSGSLYQLSHPGEFFRTMLRTGSISTPPASPEPALGAAGKCPFAYRDIPRFQQSDLSENTPVDSGRPDILIPEQRNDDNAIVAQVTALFHHLHNAVVTALRALPDMPTYGDPAPRGRQLFTNARWVTSFLYRRIIRDDLLNKLVIGAVWDQYVANGYKPLADAPNSDGIPLEFSHAAYRLGHAMVRTNYTFNDDEPEHPDHQPQGIGDILKTSSAERPHKFPLDLRWIADWSKFFRIAGTNRLQFSRRIGPCFNEKLLTADLFPNSPVGTGPGGEVLDGDDDDETKFPNNFCSGLLFSDLIRGTVGGLLTLDRILKILPTDVRGSSLLLADDARRAQVLRDWLTASRINFSEPELVELSTNPPLIFWLLFEAAYEADGCSLGTLGSIIVGDVFLARLAATAGEIDLDRRIEGNLLQLLFPTGLPSDMADLIRFTARTLGLENADPSFASN